jgi:hypothetical protein
MLSLNSVFLLGATMVTTTAVPYTEKTSIAAKYEDTALSFTGNFTMHQFQLYPENLDFDRHNGLLYLGFVFSYV